MIVMMLSGKAGSGKDTVYSIIERNFKYVHRLAFANSLKNIAKVYFGWKDKNTEKGRALLQQLGAAGRAYNQDIWANKVVTVLKNFSDFDDGDSICVITDFRFPNEYEVIKKEFKNVVTVRITGREKSLGKNSNDISEHSLDNFNFDCHLDNSGTLEDLERNVVILMNGVL